MGEDFGHLISLERRGLQIFSSAGRIEVRGSLDRLTDVDRDWIRLHRDSLVDLLALPEIAPLDVDPIHVPEIFPIGDGQLEMWTGAVTNSGPNGNPAAFDAICRTNLAQRTLLLGSLDDARLERSFARVLLRHPALRARLQRDQPQQTFFSPDAFTIEREDISSRGFSQAQLADFVREYVTQPFEFFGGKLVRAYLFRMAEHCSMFVLICNHIVSDGWSSNILRRCLEEAYFDDSGLGEAQDVAAAQMYLGYLKAEASPQMALRRKLRLARWEQWLADAPAEGSSVPFDHACPPGVGSTDSLLRSKIPAASITRLRNVAAQHSVMPGAIVAAAFLLLIARTSATRNPLVAMYDSGRWRTEFSNFVALFATNIMIGTSIQTDETISGFLKRVHRVVADRRSEPIAYREMLRALPAALRDRTDPIVRVIFNLGYFNVHQRERAAEPPLHAVRTEPAPVHGNSAVPFGFVRFQPVAPDYRGVTIPFDIGLQLHSAEGLDCCWDYDARRYDAATIEGLGEQFRRILDSLCEMPDARVGAILEATAEIEDAENVADLPLDAELLE